MIRTFPAASWAPAAARRMVDMSVAELPPSLVEDARLLASELVKNAFDHAPGSTVEVRVSSAPGRPVRIEVRDNGSGFEPSLPPSPENDLGSGWELYLVDHVATRWGVERGEGACVWAEVNSEGPA
jgi:anti-sigma regulatory factor (Ser/Thr protein kinase)